MKKLFVLSFLALMLFGGYVDELKSYLLKRDFQINGKFFVWQGKWLLGLNNEYGHIVGIYELLGSEPTPTNPFGWKLIKDADLARAKEAGLFVYVGFPKDKNRSYSWLYIDSAHQKIYKLMGAKDGVFIYLDENNDTKPDPVEGLYYVIRGSKITFFNCQNSWALHDKSVEINKLWKSLGDVVYGCDEKWSKKEDIQNIEITETLRGQINGEPFLGSIFKNFGRGIVSIEGLANGRYIVCSQTYAPPNFQEDIASLIDRWGEGYSVQDGFIAQSCNLPTIKTRSFDLESFKTILFKEQNATSRTTIYKHIIKR